MKRFPITALISSSRSTHLKITHKKKFMNFSMNWLKIWKNITKKNNKEKCKRHWNYLKLLLMTHRRTMKFKLSAFWTGRRLKWLIFSSLMNFPTSLITSKKYIWTAQWIYHSWDWEGNYQNSLMLHGNKLKL